MVDDLIFNQTGKSCCSTAELSFFVLLVFFCFILNSPASQQLGHHKGLLGVPVGRNRKAAMVSRMVMPKPSTYSSSATHLFSSWPTSCGSELCAGPGFFCAERPCHRLCIPLCFCFSTQSVYSWLCGGQCDATAGAHMLHTTCCSFAVCIRT